MEKEFDRTSLLIGEEKLNILKESKIIIFGVGGVGGFCTEALARTGVGNITVVDSDTVNITNINRQIIALHSTIGKAKVDVIEERIKDINPLCNVTKIKEFYLPENNNIDLSKYDYVIDCIDTITAKLDIIERCYKGKIKIISCMGMGNKLNPLDIEVSDVFKTSVCPLARVMRYELKKRHINKLKVVYSKEEPIKANIVDEEHKRNSPGSISFVPSVAGLVIASEVIKDIIG
ncbi:MAG: tRNA threonylcarbamoyladenosine dehydratase [Acholeplasmatales bacterium]|nr:tRNA threonylcarbamoyladenosine dehydratase [Acholeplasmatales bacterium]